jgi:hypothetical protein
MVSLPLFETLDHVGIGARASLGHFVGFEIGIQRRRLLESQSSELLFTIFH